LLEVVIVLAIILVLFVLFVPGNPDRNRRSRTFDCVNNQRQIVLGEWQWHDDNKGQWLWQVQATNTSTPDFPAIHFQSLSTYFKNLNVFVCPTDGARQQATSAAAVMQSNLSYFINRSAAPESGNPILTGDRHLEIDKLPVNPGIAAFSTNQTIHWTKELHSIPKVTKGVLGFADGHVQAVKDVALAGILQNQHVATNLLAIP